MPDESFAVKLSAAMESKGVNQYQLSKATGLAQSAVSDLMSGKKNNPSWATVQKLALALGVDVAYFIDPAIESTDVEPKPRGRPPKAEAPPEPKTKKPRKKK